MEPQKKNRTWLTCGIIAVVLLCIGIASLGGFTAFLAWLGGSVDATPQAPVSDTTGTIPTPSNVNPIPFEAVVQIWAIYQGDVSWTGSGSIITPDGYILTNAHVVLPDKYYPVDYLVIAITEAEDSPPEPRYIAEVLQADASLDIAVIRIATDLDRNPVDRNSLNLPYVPFGDPAALRLGDAVTILGYPSIGGQTITLTRGEISGFTAESGRGSRAFIKTSATIAGGNSGGLAADANGYLIGIPTQLGYGGDDQYVDCRTLADTNRDGVIDERDNCVPTGGFINALRPIDLALPLVAAARNGQVNITTGEQVVVPAQEELPSEGSVLFSDDFSNEGSGWLTGDSEDGYALYSNGEFFIQVNPDNFFIWSRPEQRYEDVIISVDARIAIPTGAADYGVICRYQDADNFYGLELTEDGYYAIWKYQNGEYTALVDWETSASVPQHTGTRTIQAACVDNTLALAVDGVLLAEVTDSSFSAGDVGLLVGTWDDGGANVAFDNFEISSPGN